MARINSFRDLDVYQKLYRLHMEVHVISLQFPKFEMYELGAQIRRSTNSAPANIAEGCPDSYRGSTLISLLKQ